MVPPPTIDLAALILSDTAIHAFTAALQGVLAAGVGAAFPSHYPEAPTRKVATLSLLYLRFVCGVTEYGDLPPIWEALARGIRRTEGMSNLNQALMWVLSSCCWVFEGRAHFSAYSPLLAFTKNISLLNPSLETVCTGGEGGGIHALDNAPMDGWGVHPWRC